MEEITTLLMEMADNCYTDGLEDGKDQGYSEAYDEGYSDAEMEFNKDKIV